VRQTNCLSPALTSTLWHGLNNCKRNFCIGKKRKEKTTPFGVNLTTSQVLYRAAQTTSAYEHAPHPSHACTCSSLQVSAQEQACTEDVVKWATAVAAADGVHGSKEVQEGVIGACSSIHHPWPAVPQLLESALPDTPIERVTSTTVGVLVDTATLASCYDTHAASHTCCNTCRAHGQ